jgi:hypothetical protein
VKPRTCVIIAYWVGEPQRDLHRLLRQIRTVDAGAPFDLRIVCNGGDAQALVLPSEFDGDNIHILNRENIGYNIKAWDEGWKFDHRHEFYLFLQTECVIKKTGWIEAFEFRMLNDAGVGLLGERTVWDRLSWAFIRASTDRDLGSSAWPATEPLHPIDTYKALMTKAGIPLGEVGTHVPTIIHFARREILEEIGGYPFFGPSYREAVGAEVAFSRLIEARRYRVCQIRDGAFAYIGHRQWAAKPWHQKFLHDVKRVIKRARRRAA